MKASFGGNVPAWAGWFIRIFAACIVAGAVGCATKGQSVEQAGTSREAIVQERAQARWDALLKEQLVEAYKFYSAASRAALSYEDFVRSMRAGFWKGAQVRAVECQAEDACDAIVTIEYVYLGSPIRAPIRETWIRAEGNWWYVQKG